MNPRSHHQHTNVDPDGGYLDAVEDGNELGEIMLGPHRPYDLDAAFTPAHRWGSRQEIRSRRHADPAKLAVDGQALVAYGHSRRQRRAPKLTPPAPARKVRQAAAVTATAARLAIPESAVRAVVFGEGKLADRARGAGLTRDEASAAAALYAARLAVHAQRPALLKRHRPARQPGRRSRPGVRSTPSHPPAAHVCGSCNQPVRGIHCGCS